MSPLKLAIASTLIALAVGGGATSCPKYTPTGTAPKTATTAPAAPAAPAAPHLLDGETELIDVIAPGVTVVCDGYGILRSVTPDTSANEHAGIDACRASQRQDQQLQDGLNGIGGGR